MRVTLNNNATKRTSGNAQRTEGATPAKRGVLRTRRNRNLGPAMWTDETRISGLIFSAVHDQVAQRLLYQAQLHHENFRNSSKQLQEAFSQLLFSDFARVNSCHMTEGVFGADIHAAEMESAKVRVWGFLLNTATSGHKMLRC